MTKTKTAIAELDVVEFKQDIGKWPAGTRGTAVIDHGRSKLVEISDDEGQDLDLIEVPEEKLKLVTHYPRT